MTLFKVLGIKMFQHRILHPEEMLFKNEGKNIFSGKEKL
jgi:hypothetical protein